MALPVRFVVISPTGHADSAARARFAPKVLAALGARAGDGALIPIDSPGDHRDSGSDGVVIAGVRSGVYALCTLWPLRQASGPHALDYCEVDATVVLTNDSGQRNRMQSVGASPGAESVRAVAPRAIERSAITLLPNTPRARSVTVVVSSRRSKAGGVGAPSSDLLSRQLSALLSGKLLCAGAVVAFADGAQDAAWIESIEVVSVCPVRKAREATARQLSTPAHPQCVLATAATCVYVVTRPAKVHPDMSSPPAAQDASSGAPGSSGRGAASRRVAGTGDALDRLLEIVRLPFLHRDAFARMGVECPKGILLSGPPGVGKTLLARAVADECGAELIVVNGPELYGAYIGDSEANLRRVFADASARAAAGSHPVMLFFDEIDALCPKRDAGDRHSARVVAQLLTLMDGIGSKVVAAAGQDSPHPSGSGSRSGGMFGVGGSAAAARDRDVGAGGVWSSADRGGHVAPRGGLIVVGATNRPNAIDAALRRPGRFDREVCMRPPDARDRRDIFAIYTRQMPLAADVDLAELATLSNGCVGADIAEVCRAAAMEALHRAVARGADTAAREKYGDGDGDGEGRGGGERVCAPDTASVGTRESSRAESSRAGAVSGPAGPSSSSSSNNSNKRRSIASVCAADFRVALSHHVPSVLRGSEVRVDPVTWDAIGGCDEAKAALRRAVEWPLLHPGAFSRLGIAPTRGILLYGPPGCSKTTLVRALAGTAGCALLYLSGAQLYSPYVGDSEKEVRDVFVRARASAPCIVFLDEIDAIVGDRNASDGGGSDGVSARVLSALLNEMDGVEAATGVLVVAATNRPRTLDAALMRPGRFDAAVLVPAPDAHSRAEIFRIKMQSMPVAEDVDVGEIVRRTEGYTGADIEAVCREAAMAALRRTLDCTRVVWMDFDAALSAVPRSLTPTQLQQYCLNPFGR